MCERGRDRGRERVLCTASEGIRGHGRQDQFPAKPHHSGTSELCWPLQFPLVINSFPTSFHSDTIRHHSISQSVREIYYVCFQMISRCLPSRRCRQLHQLRLHHLYLRRPSTADTGLSSTVLLAPQTGTCLFAQVPYHNDNNPISNV